MNKSDILQNVKVDIGISVSATLRDDYLMNLIDLAEAAITREGITLDIAGSVEDGMLVESYAAFLYRKRQSDDAKMPRSLRYLLNNRLFSEKART